MLPTLSYFLLQEKVLCSGSHIGKPVSFEMFIVSVPKTLLKKLYLRYYLTQIIHSNGKMLFL